MSTPTLNSDIPAEILMDLEEAARYAASGARDPEIARRACAEMDRIREEIRHLHGILDIGVSAIRELRDERWLTADNKLVKYLQPHFPLITPLSSLP